MTADPLGCELVGAVDPSERSKPERKGPMQRTATAVMVWIHEPAKLLGYHEVRFGVRKRSRI